MEPANNTQQSVPTEPTTPVAPEGQGSPKKKFFSKKKLVIIGLVFLALIVGIVVFTQNRGTSTQVAKLPPAEAENVLLATVGDREIRRNDVENIALEQYAASAINDKVIADFLDTAIERAILDFEAEKAFITVSDNELTEAIRESNNGITKVNPSYKQQIYYDLLKLKIMSQYVDSVEAYDIGYWVPGYNDPEANTVSEEQRIEANKALAAARTMLIDGRDPVDVVFEIYDEFPVAQVRLSMNGYKINTITEKAILNKPKLFNKEDLNTDFITKLFQLSPGAVSIIADPDGYGASVVKVVSVSSGEYESFEDFLNNKKEEYVTFIE